MPLTLGRANDSRDEVADSAELAPQLGKSGRRSSRLGALPSEGGSARCFTDEASVCRVRLTSFALRT